jgi:hypothetical protein
MALCLHCSLIDGGKMLKQKNTIISIAVALLVAACGGGGGSSTAPASGTDTGTGTTGSNTGGGTGTGTGGGTPAPASTTAGKVADGYISGAVVYCDANNNGVRDAGEAVAISGAQGDFSFSAACSGTVVASGGNDTATGLPFRGVLKAPAGSVVITPATTLLAGGVLASDKAAASLGMPAGTDVTKTDIGARGTGGAPASAEALKRSLALQQIVQQTADTIGALTSSQTPDQIQAIYVEAAKAAAAVLNANAATPLIDAGGAVNVSLVNAIVQQAIGNLSQSTVASIGGAKGSIGTYNRANVAAFVSAAIAAEAEVLAKTANSDALTKTTQSDTTIADAARQVSALLASTNPGVNMSEAAASLAQVVVAPSTGRAPLVTKLAQAIDAQGTAAGVNVAIEPTTLNVPGNFLDVVASVVKINDHEGYDLDALASNSIAFDAGTPASINTISIDVDPNGMKPATGSTTVPVSIAFELTDTGTSGQSLQMVLDQANLAIDSNNQVTVSVPSTAHLFVYGKNSAGTAATVSLATLPANLLTSTNNTLTFNTGAVLAAATAANNAVFSSLQTMKGKLALKYVISNVDLRKTGHAPVGNVTVQLNGADQTPVSGSGFQGVITVQ